MTADPLRLACPRGCGEEPSLLGRLGDHVVSRQALRPRRPGEKTEANRPVELGHLASERSARQSAEAPRLLLDLLEHPLAERKALLAKDARFRSVPLAALLIAQAKRRPAYAEQLACTAVLSLDEVGEEGRGLRVSAKVTPAEALRQKADPDEAEAAEAALVSAEGDLRTGDLPWEAAELCLAFARLR